MTKFKSEATVRMTQNEAEERFCIYVEDYYWRLRKACLTIHLSSGSVPSTVITMQRMYFSFSQEEEWFTDRAKLKYIRCMVMTVLGTERPSLFEQTWQWFAFLALISAPSLTKWQKTSPYAPKKPLLSAASSSA